MDVSGHGISAALVVARLHGLVRRLTLTLRSPVSMLDRINRAAQQMLEHTYFFLTAVVMRLDLHTGELRYATAGHPAQVLLRGEGELELLRTQNRLLGMDEDIFAQREPSKGAVLNPGDTIVLFTDGLFEVLADGEGEVLGEPGLHERLRALGAVSPPLLIGEVLQDLAEYQGRSDFDDDLTMVVARYLGPPEKWPAPAPRS
jgi:sigma-B regulation protein RsbU (phosphoserine phosphatase)